MKFKWLEQVFMINFFKINHKKEVAFLRQPHFFYNYTTLEFQKKSKWVSSFRL